MGNQNNTNEFGYNGYTIAETVVGDSNLTGRHFFITGSNSGIGFETARALYKAGGTVTIACRNNLKMQEAKRKIENLTENSSNKIEGGRIQTLILDLSSLESVREAVDRFLNNFEITKIDTLILNAGVMDVSKGISNDGFEIHMQINHFAHALLTFLLLPHFNDKEGNRIVILSSKAHRFGQISFDDMDFRKRDYSGFKAYGQSKLANIAFTKALNSNLKSVDSKIECFAVHPGVIKTNLGKDSFRVRAFYTVGQAFCKSIPQGAATSVFAALDRRLKGLGGSYLTDCGRGTVKPGSLNDRIIERFFEVTETLIGEKFPFGNDDGEKEEEEEEEEEGENSLEVEEIQEQEQQQEEEEVINIVEDQVEEEDQVKKKIEEDEEEEEEEQVEEDDDNDSIDDDDGLEDVIDESSGRKKKDETDDEEEDEIIDEASSPRKKGEEEDEED